MRNNFIKLSTLVAVFFLTALIFSTSVKGQNASPKTTSAAKSFRVSDADFKRAKIKEKKDWKKYFDAAGVTGGIVVYDLRRNKYLVYDRARMDKGFVPASTSKILHSLIFLETGAVKDENEMLKWDGRKRAVEAWNQDHNLRSAFKASAIWVYRDLSVKVGRETMQRYYDLTDYGNRSTDGFGEDYWNKGDLRVTPREQIAFLRRLYQNRVPFSERSIAVTKDLMIAEKTDKYVLRGKTGWSQDYAPQVGWLVGYVERGRDVYFFAAELDITKNEDAAKRLEITKNILRELKAIE